MYFTKVQARNFKPKYVVGDKVRITGAKKHIWNRVYHQLVRQNLYSNPSFKDFTTNLQNKDDREELEGTFYQPELQKSTEDTFRIEKILRWKWKDDGTRIARVKWVGYSTLYNSWVPETEITKYGNN